MTWWSKPDGHDEIGAPAWPSIGLAAAGPLAASRGSGVAEATLDERAELERAEREKEIRREAHAEGFEAGVRAGQESLERAARERAAVEEERARLREWLARISARLEDAALDLARELAEAALQRELAEPGQQALREARAALAAGDGAARVMVAPALAAEVAAGLAAAGDGVQVEGDHRVPPGDAVIERGDGLVLAGPTWRWRRLVESLTEEAAIRARG